MFCSSRHTLKGRAAEVPGPLKGLKDSCLRSKSAFSALGFCGSQMALASGGA